MGTSINFDGVNHEVDPVIASLITSERKKYDNDLEKLKEKKVAFEQKVDELNSELEKTKGLLKGSEEKLAQAEKIDHSQEISSRLDTWSLVLPTIQKFDSKYTPDYGLSISAIKREYLTKVHKKEKLDSKSDDYVDGLFESLAPSEKIDAQLAKQRTNEHLGYLSELEDSSNGRDKIQEVRRKLIESKEKAYKFGKE